MKSQLNSQDQNFTIKLAEEADIPIILALIKELALYEKMIDEVVATKDLLFDWLFERKVAEALIGTVDNEVVGFALFFHNFSTFLGRAGIYLEDIFIRAPFRGNGYGTKFFKRIAQIALERGCGRMEWSCLNWNKPSIDFYLSLNAKAMSDWTVYRLTGDDLEALAKKER